MTDEYFWRAGAVRNVSLRKAVAAPFQTTGRERMEESEFLVALSIERGWFSADQAKRLVDVAAGEGLLERVDGEVRVAFEPNGVEISDGFEPEEEILRERSTFERLLATLVEAGEAKQDAVAAVNRLQSDLGLTVEAAAVLYAHRQGIDVSDHAERVRAEL